MKSLRRLGPFLACVLFLLMLCPHSFADDKAGIVNKARARYYNLAARGVKEFRCNAIPNWKKFLGSTQPKAVPDDDPFLRRLNLLRFELVASPSEESKVTPSTTGPIVLDDNIMQLIAGVKDTVRGFSETWRGFMLTNPFDGCDVDSLEEGPDNYRISSKQAGFETKTLMGKDFTITEVLGNYGESKVRVAPRFTVTNEGLVLESVSNEIDGGKTRLVEAIECGEVEGLRLPSRVHIDLTQPGEHFVIDVAFENYRIGRK